MYKIIVYDICRIEVIPTDNTFMHAEVTSPNTLTSSLISFVMAIIIKALVCYLPQPSSSADNTNFGLDNYRYHAQPHPIIVTC